VEAFVEEDLGETMERDEVDEAAEDLRFRRSLDGYKSFEEDELGVMIRSRADLTEDGPAIVPTEVSIVRRAPFMSVGEGVGGLIGISSIEESTNNAKKGVSGSKVAPVVSLSCSENDQSGGSAGAGTHQR
jgi:hypothetical protein